MPLCLSLATPARPSRCSVSQRQFEQPRVQQPARPPRAARRRLLLAYSAPAEPATAATASPAAARLQECAQLGSDYSLGREVSRRSPPLAALALAHGCPLLTPQSSPSQVGRGSFALVLECTDNRTGVHRCRCLRVEALQGAAPLGGKHDPTTTRPTCSPPLIMLAFHRALPPRTLPAGERLAAKKLPKYKHNKLPCQQAAVVGEEASTLRVLSAADPASIVRLHDVRQDDSYYYIITEVGVGRL